LFSGKKIVHFTVLLVKAHITRYLEITQKFGLTSSRLPNNFVQTITTEEEIEDIEEILQCSTVNYTCDICKIEINQDEAGSIMCN